MAYLTRGRGIVIGPTVTYLVFLYQKEKRKKKPPSGEKPRMELQSKYNLGKELILRGMKFLQTLDWIGPHFGNELFGMHLYMLEAKAELERFDKEAEKKKNAELNKQQDDND